MPEHHVPLLSEQIANSAGVVGAGAIFEAAWGLHCMGEGSRQSVFVALATYNTTSAQAIRARLHRLPRGGDEYEALRATAEYLEGLATKHKSIAGPLR